jgi:hypothetical protein
MYPLSADWKNTVLDNNWSLRECPGLIIDWPTNKHNETGSSVKIQNATEKALSCVDVVVLFIDLKKVNKIELQSSFILKSVFFLCFVAGNRQATSNDCKIRSKLKRRQRQTCFDNCCIIKR